MREPYCDKYPWLCTINRAEVSAEEHSIHDNFLVFEGSMLPAGRYHYPERKGQKDEYVEYTPEDIKELTERDVRKGYIELDHSHKPDQVDITGGIGYYEILGYDEQNHADKSRFYINQKYADLLPSSDALKISPYFLRQRGPDGRMRIHVKNVAIVTKGKPRSETAGKDTTARRLN